MHDVFLSYATPDRLIADAVCHALEAGGVRVWMAPRDVPAGAPWRETIAHAILGCSLMVLIYSEHASASEFVARELDLAADEMKPLIPLRTDSSKPGPKLAFPLSGRHWLDAMTPPIEAHLAKLVAAAKKALVATKSAATEPAPAIINEHVAQAPLRPRFELPTKERWLIEQAIRHHLNLPANAPLGPAEMARVAVLNLFRVPITDAGAAWLARPDSGLTALTELWLGSTQVGDAGAAALAAKDSGLRALAKLGLSSTQVGDAGAAALAAKDSGLTALTTLGLSSTQVGDAGAAALAAKDSGLTALTMLSLSSTQVGDAGAAALAAKDSGLKALTTLYLGETQITDAGAAALAAKGSGLTALTMLSLDFTQVGDAGAAALAAKDSGLKALTTLYLDSTQVGNAGAAALAAKDSGLKALTSLDLRHTKITTAGVAAIKARYPGIQISR